MIGWRLNSDWSTKGEPYLI